MSADFPTPHHHVVHEELTVFGHILSPDKHKEEKRPKTRWRRFTEQKPAKKDLVKS